MTTYTSTASSPRFAHLRAHLGPYLAGVGVTAALTAGALVVFLSMATFVAFKGLPLFGGSSDGAGAAYLDLSASAAPTAAGVALGAAPGAVAKDPVAGFGRASGGPRSEAAAKGGSGGSGPSGSDATGKAPPGSSGGPGIGSPPGGIAPPIEVPPLPSASGPVTNAVQGVGGATGTNLSGPTRGVTRTVDGTAGGALNRAGGSAGRPRLGTRAGGAVSGITGGALGL